MANLVFIEENQLINAPSINILNQFMMFNDSFTWNVVSGTATAFNTTSLPLVGQRCLQITPTFSVATVVNSGGSETEHTITDDGNYILSIKHMTQYSSEGASSPIAIKLYINGTPTDYEFGGSADFNGQYRTYYQIIPLLSGDVIDFAFSFGTSDIGGARKNYFDAFKLELDVYGLGVPTVFSEPQLRTYESTTTIDVPSIPSNDYETVIATLTGAEVGDYVQMVYPVELTTLGLVVGYPVVTDTDEVSFVIHNHSGGAINPASGDYSFKIVK